MLKTNVAWPYEAKRRGGAFLTLKLELRQAQTVTPQMITTMTMLQYGRQELQEYLSELSYENPLMELQEPLSENQMDPDGDRLRWLCQNDRQNCGYYSAERDQTALSIPAAEDCSLEVHLREQLLGKKLPAAQRRAVAVLIGLLDGHGFFTAELAEAARLAGCPEETVREALQVLQSMEPAGVGAGSICESLLLQLTRQEGDGTLAQRILREHITQLSTLSPQRLAARLGEPADAVEDALARIARCSPYPADGFSGREETIYIKPDLYVDFDGARFTVRSEEEAAPHVRINRQYLAMLETEQDPAVQKYLREKLRQLQQVMRDLENRESTVLRCGKVLAERQQAFFGGGSLQKMTLRDVAEELGVHESTVSRAVRNKYVQCPQGLLPMSCFFSRSAGQNAGLCRENIKEALRQLILQEDASHPSSDEKLAKLLSAQHIAVSRRTVAKYRMELGILPASARRRKSAAAAEK